MNDGWVGGFLRGSLMLALPSATSDQSALESVLDLLAPVFEEATANDGERDGALLLVTDDAGSATAVQFWRDALAVGPALASPGAFPWCLANAPCAMIARRFAVTGPNITWLATRSDPHSAFDAPAAWLADHLLSALATGQPTQAWLVALHFGAPDPHVMVWHWMGDSAGRAAFPDDALALAAALRDRLKDDWAPHV